MYIIMNIAIYTCNILLHVYITMNIASDRINQCIEQKSNNLDLSNLGLT